MEVRAVLTKQRAPINISLETKLEMDSVKSSGQSYNGLIREMLKFCKEKNREYWTRRRRERQL